MAIVQIQFRRDTYSNWSGSNPILAAGEPALDTDSGTFKIGDGTTEYLLLPGITVNAAGNNGEIQFNDNGSFGALSGLTYDDSSDNINFTSNAINFFNQSNSPLFGSSIYHNKTLIPKSAGNFAYETRIVTKNSSTSSLNNTYYADVRNITDASNDDGAGTTGFALFTRNTGNHNLGYLYATDVTSRHSGIGDVGFLNGQVSRVLVDGTNTSSVSTVSRNISPNTTIDNPNTTITDIQSLHPTINLVQGTIGSATSIYIDYDLSSSPNLNITGDISYIAAGGDGWDNINIGGTKRFINYFGNLQSDFGGIINTNVTLETIESGSGKILPTKEWVIDYIESTRIYEPITQAGYDALVASGSDVQGLLYLIVPA
jgi:hypothetical protein